MSGNFGFLALAVAMALSPSASGGACTEDRDREHFVGAVHRELVCASHRLTTPDARCQAFQVPSCAQSELEEIIAVVGARAVDPGTAAESAGCLRQTYRAAIKFVKARVRERVAGRRRQGRSRHAFDRLGQCQGPPQARVAERYARSSSQCQAVFDRLPSGAIVRECLRPSLERIIGSATGLGPVAPGVVLVVTDDQHPAVLPYMPNTLKGVAAAGVRFTNAFTTTPLCGPSRAGILTGQGPFKHGVWKNGGEKNGRIGPGLDDSPTLATWFQAAGYRTALIGKYLNLYNHISPEIPPGWDDWRVFVSDVLNYSNYELNENGTVIRYGDSPAGYSTDVLARLVNGFIESSRETPFFVMFAPSAPHTPSSPAARHQGSAAEMPLWRPPSWGEEDVSDKPGWLKAFGASHEKLLHNDSSLALQRASIAAVDEAIAGILAQLEELGLSDNTIVVVTADHGIMWGEHRLITKQVAYEESIRIPMMWRYPLRLAPGQVREELVLNLDIAPTLAALAGVDMSDDFDGQSLTELLAGTTEWREEFVAENRRVKVMKPWLALRTKHFKYVRYIPSGEELYDLQNDRWEMNNLARLEVSAVIRRKFSSSIDRYLEREKKVRKQGRDGEEPRGE